VAALAVVLFCLFRPTLIVRAAVTQQNVVAVLLDDSRSMQIPTKRQAAGGVRPAAVRRADRPLLKSLADRFLVREFRFSSTAGRMARDELQFDGTQTKLGPRSKVCARSWPACRSPASCSSPTAPTRRMRRWRRPARTQGREAAGVHRRRRQRAAAARHPDRRVSTPRTV
jgi:hypothetical protein